MTKITRFAATVSAAIVGIAAMTGAASAQGSAVKVGTLTCNVASGFGFIFGSSRSINCSFSPAGGTPQHYTGTINQFGVDIGYVQGGVLIWTVLAPTTAPPPGALNGTFIGATASATAGVGVGANVLLGGSGNTISLQPLSIQGQTGLNIAAGVASLTLTYQPG